MSVSAVVVSHRHAAELERSLPSLLQQVDELVVVANLRAAWATVSRGSARDRERTSADARGEREHRDRGNLGSIRALLESRRGCRRGAVAALAGFMASRPRCGIAGPQMLWPDGTWQPSRRRFPTVPGTIVRRTPLRKLYPPYERQRDHYLLDERPDEPVQADWMLGAFLLQRRSMLEEIGGWDAGYRHYVEDIDLCYRAARAGWERWYVPGAVVGTPTRRSSTSASSPGTPSGTSVGWRDTPASTLRRCFAVAPTAKARKRRW